MQSLQDVFQRMTKQKAERKKLQALLADALKASTSWVEQTEEIKKKKAARKLLEDSLLSGYDHELEQLDKINLAIKTDGELISDIALSMFMKGETLDLETDKGKYEAKIIVSFKQMTLV